MYSFIAMPAQRKSILINLAPSLELTLPNIDHFDCLCNQLHALTCEVGLTMLSNAEFLSRNLRGERKQ